MTRGHSRKKVQGPVTEDGSYQKRVVDVKKKTEEVVKKSDRGRKKTRVVATENGDSIESGRVDVCVETSESAGWLDDFWSR